MTRPLHGATHKPPARCAHPMNRHHPCARPRPRRRPVGRLWGLALASLVLLAPVGAQAQQQPGAPAGPAAAQPEQAPAQTAGPAVPEWRLHLLLFDQYAFREHPFYQITNHPGYRGGDAATGTFVPGGRYTTDNEGFLPRLIHSLPGFEVEFPRPTNVPFPRGLSFSFVHHAFSQADVDAAGSGSVVPAIQMDVYMYLATLRAFAFDPTEPGINYYAGFSLGTLNGALNTEPYDGEVTFGQSPVGGWRFGLENRGDNWGFRYEIFLLNAEEVRLSANPYPAPSIGLKTVDYSGSIIRMTLFYQFK